MNKCDQSNLLFDDDFRMYLSFRGACFLEMSGRISFKLATNRSFRGNKY